MSETLKPNIIEIARKRRYAALLRKANSDKALTPNELRELASYEDPTPTEPTKEELASLPKISIRQQKFVYELAKDPTSAYQASIRAGFEPNAATASRLMANPKVKAWINHLQKKTQDSTMVTITYVVTNIKNVAERCMKPGMEFDAANALKALELLGKHVGAFAEDNRQKTDGFTDLLREISGKGFGLPIKNA